jgi:hypothetical protein
MVAVGVPENVRQLVDQQLAQVRPEVQAIMAPSTLRDCTQACVSTRTAQSTNRISKGRQLLS